MIVRSVLLGLAALDIAMIVTGLVTMAATDDLATFMRGDAMMAGGFVLLFVLLMIYLSAARRQNGRDG